MKRICLAVAVSVLCGVAFSGYAAAGSAGQTQTQTPVPYEPQDYSSPFGGESCSKPAPTS